MRLWPVLAVDILTGGSTAPGQTSRSAMVRPFESERRRRHLHPETRNLDTVIERSNQTSDSLVPQPRRHGRRPVWRLGRGERNPGGTTDGTDRLERFERTPRLTTHPALPRRRKRRYRLREPIGGKRR